MTASRCPPALRRRAGGDRRACREKLVLRAVSAHVRSRGNIRRRAGHVGLFRCGAAAVCSSYKVGFAAVEWLEGLKKACPARGCGRWPRRTGRRNRTTKHKRRRTGRNRTCGGRTKKRPPPAQGRSIPAGGRSQRQIAHRRKLHVQRTEAVGHIVGHAGGGAGRAQRQAQGKARAALRRATCQQAAAVGAGIAPCNLKPQGPGRGPRRRARIPGRCRPQ